MKFWTISVERTVRVVTRSISYVGVARALGFAAALPQAECIISKTGPTCKRPADRAVSPCGSRGLSPQIVLQPVFAPDAATGIGLSIYFRFVPFISIAG